MRLTKIKLAGFKSFVDPTIFYMPSNLVGIVGPNGCGKSNIIDAVRWVMGESSVRTLRGESMVDVIFNGSSTRKPVGQAFVELTFDNSDGKLGGAWIQYSEIAIKRLVSRDGQSGYFLNGSRCRRRDITDIFLGTGLGARSYAIIEQGMISRIVEAKPEELRVFLEEAAGISKYKDRRRETETRMRRTQENLDRLTDVREELAKQAKHLQRQARSAEQYKQYRAEERCLKAQILAWRWRCLDADVKSRQALIREQEIRVEAVVAEQHRLEALLEAGRERHADLNEEFNRVQERYYAVGASISRLELSLEHQRELRQRQGEELRQAEQGLVQVLEQISLDRAKLEELENLVGEMEPDLVLAQATGTQVSERLTEAESATVCWQSEWEDFSQRASTSQRTAEVERTRIKHLERQLLQHSHRMEKLQREQDSLHDTELRETWEELHLLEQQTETALELRQQELDELAAQAVERRELHRQLTQEQDGIREHIQTGHGRLASLRTLQEAALGRRGDGVGEWLKSRGLEQAPRLAERLEVEPGWERAAEVVLDHHLEAVCVTDLGGPAVTLEDLGQGSLTLIQTSVNDNGAVPLYNDALVNKIRTPWSLSSVLSGVRLATDLDEALERRGELADWESLVTPDGMWLGRAWLRVARGTDEKFGIFAREREIQSLASTLRQDEYRLESVTDELEKLQGELRELDAQRAELQNNVNQGHRDHARLQGQMNTLRSQLDHYRVRQGVIAEEINEQRDHSARDQEELREARTTLEQTLVIIEQLSAEREVLVERRDTLAGDLAEWRAQATTARQVVQQQVLAIESLRNNSVSTKEALARLEVQRAQLTVRQEQLAEGLPGDDDKAERQQLEDLLTTRLQVEEDLSEARRALESQDADVRSLEQARTTCERQTQELRQVLEKQRLALGEASVRGQTLLDQLDELGADLAAVLAEMPAGTGEVQLQTELERLEKRIQRLGPINLAAIEEFAQLTERKHYLDAQHEDLVEALSTLENAIRRIDRETRSRFKDTFGRVNEGLQRLFPRLFGGGQAFLELVGEDMLDAGVTIMARPPGKRIGHIHLLSGGEKALTAVALVFAIFQLNPAPFCLLDEVDAPLDEANVGRFSGLVREMSDQVQFIFITHNKGTMEIARHLSGVTMHEPGVSRLVSVDVAEAVRLAAE